MGKRVVIPVRVSEPMAAAIDAARGDTPRSVWVEDAISAKLAPRRKAPEKRGGSIAPRNAPTPPKSTALPQPPPAGRSDCPHPKARVIKGFCGACGRSVL